MIRRSITVLFDFIRIDISFRALSDQRTFTNIQADLNRYDTMTDPKRLEVLPMLLNYVVKFSMRVPGPRSGLLYCWLTHTFS